MSLYETLRDALRTDAPIALATVVDSAAEDGGGPARPVEIGAKLLVRPETESLGGLGTSGLDRVVERDALAALDAGRTTTRRYGRHGEARGDEVSIFIEAFAPAPRMIIFGAVDFTAALVRVAKVLGYRVTVCDARPAFATRARFPVADEVVVDWPDRYLGRIGPELGGRDAVCVLTHDHKFDVPAIAAALKTSVGYLGAMGSRRTHSQRMERLRGAGVDSPSLERVMGPIGLDIGARTPEETAISICAEIIALRAARAVAADASTPVAVHDAASLRDREGPIHQERLPH